MKYNIFILMIPGEVKLGGVRLSNIFALTREESACAIRPWLRGTHTGCDCGALRIGNNSLGGWTVGVAVESVAKRGRQMSGNRTRANVS